MSSLHLLSRFARPDGAQGLLLAGQAGVPEPALRVAGASADDGPREVAEITRPCGAGEEVEDNEFVGAQRAVAALVRVAGLFAAGHDGVGREAASAQDGRVDLRAEDLGGQRSPAPAQGVLPADLGGAQDIQAACHPDFGDGQGLAHEPQFRGGLEFAPRPEQTGLRHKPDAGLRQASGQAEREGAGHRGAPHLALPEEGDGVFQEAGVPAFLQAPGDPRIGHDPVHPRLLAPAIDLEVAEDDRGAPALLEEDEGVRHEKAGGVEHVGVLAARRDDEFWETGGGLAHAGGNGNDEWSGLTTASPKRAGSDWRRMPNDEGSTNGIVAGNEKVSGIFVDVREAGGGGFIVASAPRW